MRRFIFLQIIQMMINIFGFKKNLKMMFEFILMKLILIKLIKIKSIWSYLMILFFQIRKYQHFLPKVENKMLAVYLLLILYLKLTNYYEII